MHKIAHQGQVTIGPCAHWARLGILGHMSLRHKQAEVSTTRPHNHGQSRLASRATLPNIARVTQPSQDVRRQVKVARSALDLTQQQLARKARVSRGTIQNLENGIRLDEATEAKIEAALGKPVGWLDDLRAGRTATVGTAEPTSRADPAPGTVGHLRRELAYFHGRLRESPEDYQRLLALLDLYAALSDSPVSTDSGAQADAHG